MGNHQSVRKVIEDNLERDMAAEELLGPPKERPATRSDDDDAAVAGKSRSASFSYPGEYRHHSTVTLEDIKKQDVVSNVNKKSLAPSENTKQDNVIEKSPNGGKIPLRNRGQVPFKETIDMFIEGYLLEKDIVLSDELGKVKAVYSNHDLYKTGPTSSLVATEQKTMCEGKFLSFSENNDEFKVITDSNNKEHRDTYADVVEKICVKNEVSGLATKTFDRKNPDDSHRKMVDINQLIEIVIDNSLNDKLTSNEEKVVDMCTIQPNKPVTPVVKREIVKEQEDKKAVDEINDVKSLREHIDRIVQESIRECNSDESKSENLVSMVDRSSGRRSSSFSKPKASLPSRPTSPGSRRQHALMRNMLDSNTAVRHGNSDNARTISHRGLKYQDSKPATTNMPFTREMPPLAEAIDEAYRYPTNSRPAEMHREKSHSWGSQHAAFSAPKKHREYHGIERASIPHLVHAEKYYSEQNMSPATNPTLSAQYHEHVRASEGARTAARRVAYPHAASDVGIVPSPQLFSSEYQAALRTQLRPEVSAESVHPSSCDCNRCVAEMTRNIGLADGYSRFLAQVGNVPPIGLHSVQTACTKGNYSALMSQSQHNLHAVAPHHQPPNDPPSQPSHPMYPQPHVGIIPPPGPFNTYASNIPHDDRETVVRASPREEERPAPRQYQRTGSPPYSQLRRSPIPQETAPTTATANGTSPLDLSVKTTRPTPDKPPHTIPNARMPSYICGYQADDYQRQHMRRAFDGTPPMESGNTTSNEQYPQWKSAAYSKSVEYRRSMSPRHKTSPSHPFSSFSVKPTEPTTLALRVENIITPQPSPTDQGPVRSVETWSHDASRNSASPSNDADRKDSAGARRGSVSKHEPIQNILGANPPSDILYLICRLCGQTCGSLYAFRKHFRNQHGFEPHADHTIVQTISATKSAMNSSVSEFPIHHQDGIPVQYSCDRSRTPSSNSGSMTELTVGSGLSKKMDIGEHLLFQQQSRDTRTEIPLDTEADGLNKAKCLECPECGQTFQLNDFGAYKRHCRQHSCVSRNSGLISCSECSTCVRDLLELKEHKQIHTSRQSSVCRICSIEFRDDDLLRDHVRDAHGATTPDRFVERKPNASDRLSPLSLEPMVRSRDVTLQPADQLGAVSASPDSSTPHESSGPGSGNSPPVVPLNSRSSPVSDCGASTDNAEQCSAENQPQEDDDKTTQCENNSNAAGERPTSEFSYKHKKFGKHRLSSMNDNSCDQSPPRKTKRSDSVDSNGSQYNSVDSTQSLSKNDVSGADTAPCVVSSSLPVEKKPDFVDGADKELIKSSVVCDEKYAVDVCGTESQKHIPDDKLSSGAQKTEARHNMPFMCDRTKPGQRQTGVLVAGKK